MTDVWVSQTSNRKRIYHTDDECDVAGTDLRRWSLDDARAMDYGECDLCAADGDWSVVNSAIDGNRTSLRALLRMGEVDHIEGHPEDDA